MISEGTRIHAYVAHTLSTSEWLSRLLRSILLYLCSFWDPIKLPLSAKGMYFVPRVLLNSLVVDRYTFNYENHFVQARHNFYKGLLIKNLL